MRGVRGCRWGRRRRTRYAWRGIIEANPNNNLALHRGLDSVSEEPQEDVLKAEIVSEKAHWNFGIHQVSHIYISFFKMGAHGGRVDYFLEQLIEAEGDS